MQTATIRPYMTTGIAIVGASVIAVSPIYPVTAPPDIAIPLPTISSQAYELAFHEELLAGLAPLLEGLSPAQFLAALDDLGLLVGAALNPLFGGLALVVDELLEGLTQVLAEGVVPVVEALVPVIDTLLTGLVPVLATVFAGLSAVVLSLTPVVATLVTGLAVIVAELVPVLLPVTVGLGVLLGGLPVVLLPLTVGLGALLGGLFGVIPLAAPVAAAAAGPATFGATDIENTSAAQTFELSVDPTVGQEGTLPEAASPVAEVATDPEAVAPVEVLTEVQETLPEQAQGVGLETAIENQEEVTAVEASEAEPEDTATDTSGSSGSSGSTSTDGATESSESGSTGASSGSAGASDSADGASGGGADSGSDSAGGDSTG